MQESIDLKILSSERMIAKKKVDYVLVPNVEGVLRVLPNHCNYTSILSKGKVVYKEQGSEEEESLDILGGVCSLIGGKLEVLVDD